MLQSQLFIKTASIPAVLLQESYMMLTVVWPIGCQCKQIAIYEQMRNLSLDTYRVFECVRVANDGALIVRKYSSNL